MRDSGDCLYIHYGDLYKGFSYCIDVERQQKPIPYILSSEKIKDEQRLLDQDIVYVLTSETVDDLGHSFLFNNPQHVPAVAGTETTIVRVKDHRILLPAYLNYLMHSPRFLKMLRQYVRGMKVFRVHPRDVARIEIELPTIETQRKTVVMLDAIHEKLLVNVRTNGYLFDLAATQFNEALRHGSEEVKLSRIVKFEDSKRIPLNSRDRACRQGPFPILRSSFSDGLRR
jgi:type I restriction enzyme S subunit